jgi:SAM-dependent methyltransferase
MTISAVSSLVLDKNTKAAGMWSSGGRAYDEVSRGVSEGIRHCVMRLDPKEGERILDIATGTGLTARYISRSGAKVTGVDIADGLLEAARQLAEEEGLFGIMYATNQDAAISELARVVRPGGRIAVAAWLPDSTVVALRKVLAPFMPPPPPSPPPSFFNWGETEWLKGTLGAHFELGHERGELTHRAADAEEVWRVYEDGFGPVRATSQALDADKRAELKAAFIDWLRQFSTDLGIALTYQYLVTVGIRR